MAGSGQTPALCWVLALQALPAASIWHHDGQQWHCLAASASIEAPDRANVRATKPVPAATAPLPSAVPATSPAESAKPTIPAVATDFEVAPSASPEVQMDDSTLIRKVFLFSAWGEKPEHLRRIALLSDEADKRGPDVRRRTEAARRNGQRARRLEADMKKVFDNDGQLAAENWIDKHTRNQHYSIARHLRIQLGKRVDYQRNLARRYRDSRSSDRSELAQVSLGDGQHPNSLRSLPNASHWHIYIDETGDTFDDAADELRNTDGRVGRLVALAVPNGVNLPPLKPGFHAADETAAAVDKAVGSVLAAQVGVLGFSVQDASARHQYWLGHIQHLLRWVLLQLPAVAAASGSCRVDVHIEQRSRHTAGSDLSPLAETLESELKGIDPDRFGKLLLKLDLVDKNEPMIGYVDAIAFTWGSPSAAARDRLKKSALRGHCLVEAGADQADLHHLYLALSEQRTLLPTEWYALCSAAASEPEHGFLARGLAQSAQQLSPDQWAARLAEVQQRLRSKDYQLSEVALALDWLQQHAPRGSTLPAPMELALGSARLAGTNHLGQVDASLVERCQELALQLRDEVPGQAIEALLRIASATTNTFEFDVLRDTIRDWSQQPLGVGGLAKHAKLQSTLGQMLAFTGQPGSALPAFNSALKLLNRLSDQDQRKLELLQTGSYRIMADMDHWLGSGSDSDDGQQLLTRILRFYEYGIDKADPQAISRSLAASGQGRRYLHHLWLRSIICMPELLAEAGTAYLERQSQWQQEEDHPWPLIAAYRAWLLLGAGRPDEAIEHMGRAIDLSAGSGATLQWMAEVLRTLGQGMRLHLPADYQPGAAERARLQELLPFAPHKALVEFATDKDVSRERWMWHLDRCLPFSFH